MLAKVTTGNADAGVVYATDVIDAGSAVQGVPLPEAQSAVNQYPIAALTEAPQPEEAGKFVEYVLSEKGQKVFEAAGFGTP